MRVSRTSYGAMLALIALCGACGGRRNVVKATPANVRVGSCADPTRDGVMSQAPRLERADRDLDGDRAAETVVTDRGLCSAERNCYWNVFSAPREGSCQRYLGTIAAAAIDEMGERGEDGYHDLRGWWRLSGGGRLLLQQYRFQQGGYRVVDALLCREQADDRLLCAAEQRVAP